MIRPAAKIQKDLAQYSPSIFKSAAVISGIAFNAANVKPGDLFVALAGAKTHGINFAQTAIANGAVAVLTDLSSETEIKDLLIPVFKCQNPRFEMGKIAAWFYDKPFEKLTAIGITGTNGKTTSASFVNQLLKSTGKKCAFLGTVNLEINDQKFAAERTTPESVDLQSFAAAALEQGVTHLVMEVSSHALALDRVIGCHFKVSAFTNLTQDHLDFHGTMENYFQAKAKLFTSELSDSSVLNIDDGYAQKLSEQLLKSGLATSKVSCKNNSADVSLVNFDASTKKLELQIKGQKLVSEFNFFGSYNLENLMIAIGICVQLGVPIEELAPAISDLKPVPGRLEQINAGQKFLAFADYAHTPDAVIRVLKTAREFTTGKVIGVLGCGGDRDASKRSPMGNALNKNSDVAIFTSDNPRSEPAESILKQMTSGITVELPSKIIIDRKAAIEYAVRVANPDDCVLVLGKGHEVGQENSGNKTPFDDRIELKTAIINKLKGENK